MGYFSNGTEGQMYEEEYCDKCVHYQGCPVWTAHLIYNYSDVNAPHQESPSRAILDMLIPRSKEGCYNDRCNMFHPKEESNEI